MLPLLLVSLLLAGPVNQAPPHIVGPARVSAPLTVDPGTWAGAEPISFAYAWGSCDANGANCVPLVDDATGAQATTQTIPSLHAPVGTTVVAVVSATDANGTTS